MKVVGEVRGTIFRGKIELHFGSKASPLVLMIRVL
jgi:hypothetical protein